MDERSHPAGCAPAGVQPLQGSSPLQTHLFPSKPLPQLPEKQYLCRKEPDMAEFAEKYISPFTGFGFRRLFGEEPNKGLLLDFLNELLKEEQGQIKELTYLKNEHVGTTEIDRKAIFDLYCENERGEKFIVELQKTKQSFFKDRTVYYSTFPIREQAKRADWRDYYILAQVTVLADDTTWHNMAEMPNFSTRPNTASLIHHCTRVGKILFLSHVTAFR
jgi:hypothetical protein